MKSYQPQVNNYLSPDFANYEDGSEIYDDQSSPQQQNQNNSGNKVNSPNKSSQQVLKRVFDEDFGVALGGSPNLQNKPSSNANYPP